MIDVDMVDAVKVQFLKPIFEDDFPERGMVAWLTRVDWHDDCYHLFFDFSEFEAENDKYFREVYYPNCHTEYLPEKPLYTAKEAGMYRPKYSTYFSVTSDGRNDELFSVEIEHYLRQVK